MENFRFNGHVETLISTPKDKQLDLSIVSDGNFKLIINYKGKILNVNHDMADFSIIRSQAQKQ